MDFITQSHYGIYPSTVWMRKTLDLLSSSATLEQLTHILDGYADFYQLELSFTKINGYNPVQAHDIQRFRGISNNDEPSIRRKNVAYIMCNTENMSFAVLYASDSNDQPHVSFAQDDERISDEIGELLERWNHESKVTIILLFNFSLVFM